MSSVYTVLPGLKFWSSITIGRITSLELDIAKGLVAFDLSSRLLELFLEIP
jgi:hypothetical protein